MAYSKKKFKYVILFRTTDGYRYLINDPENNPKNPVWDFAKTPKHKGVKKFKTLKEAENCLEWLHDAYPDESFVKEMFVFHHAYDMEVEEQQKEFEARLHPKYDVIAKKYANIICERRGFKENWPELPETSIVAPYFTIILDKGDGTIFNPQIEIKGHYDMSNFDILSCGLVACYEGKQTQLYEYLQEDEQAFVEQVAYMMLFHHEDAVGTIFLGVIRGIYDTWKSELHIAPEDDPDNSKKAVAFRFVMLQLKDAIDKEVAIMKRSIMKRAT